MAAVAALAVTIIVAPQHSASAAISPTSRAAITAAYRNVYLPAVATNVGWTGTGTSCEAGNESAASQKATLTAVNWVRNLAGLSPVTLDASHSKQALAAALVYRQQGDLSHDIPKNWPCYTSAAKKAGANSNIALGYSGASAVVSAYMTDPGAGNEAAGHRRWLLNPSTQTIGTGSTDNSNALWVLDIDAKKYRDPKWVSWPTAGYFPSQFEPDGRWSFSGDATGTYDFNSVKITVRTASGTALKVTKHRQDITQIQGNDTVVFEVAGLSVPKGTNAAKAYTVSITGIKKVGTTKRLSHSYTVRLFDPAAGVTD